MSIEYHGSIEHNEMLLNLVRKKESVTQENVYLFVSVKVGWLTAWLVEDTGISIEEAIKRIYHSELYKKLSTESTKYWHLGPVDLYEELKEEMS